MPDRTELSIESGTQEGAELHIRLSRLETYCLDEWIEGHAEPRPSRTEAVRRLIHAGLTGHPGQ